MSSLIILVICAPLYGWAFMDAWRVGQRFQAFGWALLGALTLALFFVPMPHPAWFRPATGGFMVAAVIGLLWANRRRLWPVGGAEPSSSAPSDRKSSDV